MKLLIFLLLVAVVLSKTTCGGNCPSGQCGGCPCGVDANPVDITVWCAKYSWSQACCRCIVSHESGGNANAINFSLQTYYSAGLWQINEVTMHIFSNFGLHVQVYQVSLVIPVKIWCALSVSTTILATGALGIVIQPAAADDT